MRLIQHISPRGFGKFKEFLLEAECLGHSPDAAASIALRRFGFPVIPGVETVFVIDWSAQEAR